MTRLTRRRFLGGVGALGVAGMARLAPAGEGHGDTQAAARAAAEIDPVTNRWRARKPMPTARSGIAAAVLDGKIFVFGGEATAGTFNQVEAYDPRLDSWGTYTPMPTARHGLGAVAMGGRIYVISGGPAPGGSASAVNEIFTP